MASIEKDAYRVSTRWHPWIDKRGMRHLPTYLRGGKQQQHIYSTFQDSPLYTVHNMEDLISTVTGNGLMTLARDVLDTRVLPYADDLLGDERVTPYLSKTGNVAALKLSTKKKSGFLIPASTWKYDGEPTPELIHAITTVFRLLGYEATTPSSLSEKVLRSTLPTHSGIFRPSVWVRRDILNNHRGGRIDSPQKGEYYPYGVEYDGVKFYCAHARHVVSPFEAPVILFKPSIDECSTFTECWIETTFICHAVHIPPFLLFGGQAPQEGEVVTIWLWWGEVTDALEAGYTLVSIQRGYGFRSMSNFMEQWSDILWDTYEKAHNESPLVRDILKACMVGLPGRFLRQPENYVLIPFDEAQPGDIPLRFQWEGIEEEERQYFTRYAVRAVYDLESTALSPQGSYIVAASRRTLYKMMKQEEAHGFKVIRSYIDNYVVGFSELRTLMEDGASVGVVTANDHVGNSIGQWKKKELRDIYTEENRIVAKEVTSQKPTIRAPAFSSDERIKLLKRYQKVLTA